MSVEHVIEIAALIVHFLFNFKAFNINASKRNSHDWLWRSTHDASNKILYCTRTLFSLTVDLILKKMEAKNEFYCFDLSAIADRLISW